MISSIPTLISKVKIMDHTRLQNLHWKAICWKRERLNTTLRFLIPLRKWRKVLDIWNSSTEWLKMSRYNFKTSLLIKTNGLRLYKRNNHLILNPRVNMSRQHFISRIRIGLWVRLKTISYSSKMQKPWEKNKMRTAMEMKMKKL